MLEHIRAWADSDDTRHIFWLSGWAGTGKSTIARTVAQENNNRKRLGASFFFTRGGGDVSRADNFFTSIAVQFAHNAPPLQHYIREAITQRRDIATQTLRDQWRQLVLGPLSKLNGNANPLSYILVVDALDECDDENYIRIILQLLAEARSLKTVRLRVFLTSRPDIPIRHSFNRVPEAEHQDFVLHNISSAIVDNDIYLYLEHSLRLIGQERGLEAGWPGEEIVRRLTQKASGLFIWAATACRFIQKGKQFTTRRLAMILESSSNAITAPEKHLDDIYNTVLEHSMSSDYTDEERKELYGLLRHILGSIVVLFSPLSADSLARLLNIAKEDINQSLEDLHAILDIPKDQTHLLRLHHPSFRDFLLNRDRCGNVHFWVDDKQVHRTLAESCIQLMSASLKQDICGLDAPGALVADIESSRVERSLPPELQYACLYWIQHLQKSDAQFYDNGQVHLFLQVHLLHWLEALGWIGKSSEGILAILSLEALIPVSLLYNILESLN
jgi:hypothetical protein